MFSLAVYKENSSSVVGICVRTEAGFAKQRSFVQVQCCLQTQAICDAMKPHFREINRGSSEGPQGAAVVVALNSAKGALKTNAVVICVNKVYCMARTV